MFYVACVLLLNADNRNAFDRRGSPPRKRCRRNGLSLLSSSSFSGDYNNAKRIPTSLGVASGLFLRRPAATPSRPRRYSSHHRLFRRRVGRCPLAGAAAGRRNKFNRAPHFEARVNCICAVVFYRMTAGAEIRPNLIIRDVLCLWRSVPPPFGGPASAESHRFRPRAPPLFGPRAPPNCALLAPLAWESSPLRALVIQRRPSGGEGPDRLSWAGQIRRDTAAPRQESPASTASGYVMVTSSYSSVPSNDALLWNTTKSEGSRNHY